MHPLTIWKRSFCKKILLDRRLANPKNGGKNTKVYQVNVQFAPPLSSLPLIQREASMGINLSHHLYFLTCPDVVKERKISLQIHMNDHEGGGGVTNQIQSQIHMNDHEENKQS